MDPERPVPFSYGDGVNASRLLLAAFPPEFADLGDHPLPGWHLACTGVGAVAAAVATTRLLAEHRPRRVLFLGTCGAYDDRLDLGSFIAVTQVIAVSLDELEGRAYRPGIETIRWEAGWSLPFPDHTVAVPPAITQTCEGAQRLSTMATAEHLELSGVYAACQAADIPVAAALVVVNRVGPQAHAEWKARHAEGSRQLVAALRRNGVLD
jgi:nucleoside phosphorylase